MKFKIAQKALAVVLDAVQGIIEKRATIPVLQNVLVEVSGKSKLKITATDLNHTIIRTSGEATVEEAGSICIPGHKLLQIVKALPDDAEISFAGKKNHWLKIAGAQAKYRIAGVSVEQFPAVEKVPAVEKDAAGTLTLDGEAFRNMIARVAFCMSHERSRFTLHGAKFEVGKGKMRMVATDGYRLSLVDEKIESDVKEKYDLLLPHRALQEVKKLKAEEIHFAEAVHHVFFSTGDTELVMRKLTGNFPNYEMVLPKDNDRSVTFEAEVLRSVMRRANAMADEVHRRVTLELTPAKCTIKSSTVETGEYEETIETEFDGKPIMLAFNNRYLTEYLNILGEADKAITISFKDEHAQTEFSTDGDKGFRYVLMPLRV